MITRTTHQPGVSILMLSVFDTMSDLEANCPGATTSSSTVEGNRAGTVCRALSIRRFSIRLGSNSNTIAGASLTLREDLADTSVLVDLGTTNGLFQDITNTHRFANGGVMSYRYEQGDSTIGFNSMSMEVF